MPRYDFQALASEVDPRAREHPEIGFVFGDGNTVTGGEGGARASGGSTSCPEQLRIILAAPDFTAHYAVVVDVQALLGQEPTLGGVLLRDPAQVCVTPLGIVLLLLQLLPPPPPPLPLLLPQQVYSIQFRLLLC